MKRGLISRRHLLHGIGNVAIALPVLEAMGTTKAYAATGFPKRFVTVFTANGTIYDKWRPTGTAASFTMGPILTPLAPHQDKLVVIDGLYQKHANGDAHTDGMGAALTGMPIAPTSNSTGYATGISIDQVIAKDIGKTTKLSSLELAVGTVVNTVWGRLSYLGNNQPIPPEGDPAKAFARLFGAASGPSTPSAPNGAQILRDQRKTVLDSVLEDYGALSKRLGTSDRSRVDAHLGAIRDIESRLDATASTTISCSPTQPTSTTDFGAIGKLQMDLLVMALACDSTRVATLLWDYAANNRRYPFIGVDDEFHNGIHNGHFDNVQKILTWCSEQHAYLLSKMKAVPEGGGTMLDNTLVFFTSEQANGNKHLHDHMPFLLAGNAGGALKTGRWLQYSGDPPHNNLLVSILNLMGNPATTFGKPDWCTGPLSGLV
jgi:hypothetical protein